MTIKLDHRPRSGRCAHRCLVAALNVASKMPNWWSTLKMGRPTGLEPKPPPGSQVAD